MTSQRQFRLATTTLLLVLTISVVASAGVRVALDQVPAPAVKAIKDRFPKAEIRFVDKEPKGFFEFALQDGPRQLDVSVTAEGKLLDIKEEVAIEKLPQVVKEAVAKKHPDGKIIEAEKVTTGDGESAKVRYDLLVKAGNDSHTVTIDDKGKVLEPKN